VRSGSRTNSPYRVIHLSRNGLIARPFEPPQTMPTDLPDGRSREKSVQPLREKYSAFPVGQIISTSSPRPASQRGGSRSSRTRGGMRWTRAAPKTRALIPRTAKSCGPDAPTLVSSFAKQFARRRWQESPVTGESAKETVKTIAQGRPGETGEPVVTMLVCFYYFAREAAGAAGTRLSLRPLFFEGGNRCTARARRAARTRKRVFSAV
jgi:hypothetical protein